MPSGWDRLKRAALLLFAPASSRADAKPVGSPTAAEAARSASDGAGADSAAAPANAGPPRHFASVTIVMERVPTGPELATVEAMLVRELKIPVRAANGPLTAPSIAVSGEEAQWGGGGPDTWPSLLRMMGQGFDDASGARAERFRGFMVIVMALPEDLGFQKLRTFQRMVGDAAEQLQGVVRDSLTREVDTAAAWRERKVDSWQEHVADASKQIAMISHPDGGLVTTGMAQFGLYDLFMEPGPAELSATRNLLLTMVAQHLLEGVGFDGTGRLELDPRSLRHPAIRALAGDGAAPVMLVPVPPGTLGDDLSLGAMYVRPIDGPGSAAERERRLQQSLFGPPQKPR